MGKQACSDHVKCVGWTWTSGKCYIKSSVGCMTYDPAATSGYCRPWSGPPGCGGANFLMEADDVYCDPTQTDPLQFCPGEVACPNCGSNHCACPSAAYCDPTQTDPPQLCPGEKACPDCGSNRCACPALLAPAPAPAGSECSNNWEVNNNGGENIPPGDKPVRVQAGMQRPCEMRGLDVDVWQVLHQVLRGLHDVRSRGHQRLLQALVGAARVRRAVTGPCLVTLSGYSKYSGIQNLCP